MAELDSTIALLSSNLPVGGDPNSVKDKKKSKKSQPITKVDSDEDEIFFGEKTDKELHGKNSKFTRRETLHLGTAFPKRSIDITPAKKVWMDYRVQENSIEEEESVVSTRDEENDENVDPKVNSEIPTDSSKLFKSPVKPSPRKIDSEKLKDLDLSPSKMKTPPRKIINDDHESSDEDSILDVNNDQMFEDSIYTEYDDKNLSCMSNKMAKKWRKRWQKEDSEKNTFTADTIDRLVAKQRSLIIEEEEIKIDTPDQPQDEAEEDVNNLSTCSDWFNTTRDEMILFEKFGEDYDEVVNKMTHDEKKSLRKEVDNCVPKSAEELLAMHNKQEDLHERTLHDDEEEYKTQQLFVPSPVPIPKPRTLTPKKESPVKTPSMKAVQGSTPSTLKKLFKSPGSLHTTPGYARPTTASTLRMSPRRKDIQITPGKFQNEQKLFSSCPRAGFSTSPDLPIKPKSLKKVAACNIDFNKIVSPVGQYIRSNPVPPIIRHVRPKATKDLDDELAAFERDEELCLKSPSPEKKRLFKPIPMAEYKSSKVAFETPVSSGGESFENFKTLPPKFGMEPTVQATVVRHVGRQKVNMKMLQENSPKGNLVFKKPDPTRESILPDTTSEFMDLSIRQVVEVKKLTSKQ